MDLFSAMRIYVRAVERKSISEAARDLNMGQSSVSERIARLEKHLGTRLLLRSSRTFSCTAEGNVFYEHSKRIIEASEAAIISVSQSNQLIKGLLRMACAQCFGDVVLPEILMAIRDTYPKLSLDITLNDKIVDPVAEGVDISLRLGKVYDGSFIAYKLGHVRRVLVASPSYLERNNPILTPNSLILHPFIKVKGIFPNEQISLQKEGEKLEMFPINTVVATSHWQPMYRLIINGRGIGVLQKPACVEALEQGDLVEILPQYSVPSFELNALIQAQRPVPPKLKAIIDLMKKEIPPILNW